MTSPALPFTRRLPAPSLSLYYVALLGLLYFPIGILVLYSLNAGTILSFPLQGLTLDWYGRLLDTGAVLHAARNSFFVASGSSLVATAFGTTIALLITRFQFRAKFVLFGLSLLPLIVPFVVLAVALLLTFRALDVRLSLLTIAIGHTIVAMPYAVLIVTARLTGFDPRLEEAAFDLGANYPTMLRRVVLPIIAPAMVSAWLTAFTVSFDEFALALFLAGTEPTFPVYLFSQLRFANRLPIMIAMAVLLTLGSLTLVLLAERIRRVE